MLVHSVCSWCTAPMLHRPSTGSVPISQIRMWYLGPQQGGVWLRVSGVSMFTSYVLPSMVLGSEHGLGFHPCRFCATQEAGAYPVKITFTGSSPSSVCVGTE